MSKWFSLLAIVFILLTSCQVNKKLVLMQGLGENVNLATARLDSLPEPVIKNGDLLYIDVYTLSMEASAPYNKLGMVEPGATSNLLNTRNNNSNSTVNAYLVDKNGEIEFPVIGKLKVVGMTHYQLEDFIRKQTYPRFLKENPIVTVRFQGFSVFIMKELGGATEVTTTKERINILEAIAKAGGLSITSRRDNVLVIRENQQGKREVFRVDLTDKNLIYSPYYYLQQNDLVYIEPSRNSLYSTVLSSNWGVAMQVISPFLTLTSLLLLLKK
ncbi:MAG: polysaccharide biosynthesis/export family protein [Bacteroidota bacterium]|nr:polysaccharide biosynthesis/export family protein [Bacteroidota bacterium]